MKSKLFLVRMFVVASALLSQIAAPSLQAQNTDIWTGGGGGADLFWLDGVNWQSGNHPGTGDKLVFTNTVGLINSNNYPAGQLFAGITFATPSGAFALNGNSVTLTNNITDQQPVTPETINLPLILSGSINVDVAANGTLNLATNISGGGGLTLVDSGTVNLTATNTFSGGLTVNAGTAAVNTDTNLGGGNIVLNGGTLQALATFNLNTNRSIVLGPTSGSGQGGISVNNFALVPNPLITLTNGTAMANNGGGTGGLTKSGFGNLLLFGPNTYTGATSNEVGTITLDFTQTGAPQNNIINSSSPLFFGGANAGAGVTNFAQLTVIGSANNNDTQTFNNTHVTVGNAIIRVNSGTGHSANLALNNLDHDFGGTLAMVLPASGSITTTTANNNGTLGGWATIASGAVSTGWNVATNWACNDGNNNIVNFTNYMVYNSSSALMKNYMNAASNIDVVSSVSGYYTNDLDGTGSTNDVNSIVFDNANASPIPVFFIGSNNVVRLGKFGGLFNRTTGAGFNDVLGGTNVLGPSNTNSLGVSYNQLSFGTLTAGGPSGGPGEIVFVNTTTGSSTPNNWLISSKIADNFAGPVSIVLVGSGYDKFESHNTYSGGTYLLGGRFQLDGSTIGTPNYNDAMGTGPVYIFPGSYLYLGSSGSTYVVGGVTNVLEITNDIYMAGIGTVQENDGAIRAGAFNIIASKITLIGDSGIGGGNTNQPATITGPISGPFNMYFGANGNAGGAGTGLILSNQCLWTGNTYFTAEATSSLGSTRILLGENNPLPNGFGHGNLYIGTPNTSAHYIELDMNGFNQTINGLFSGGTSLAATESNIVCNSANGTTGTLTFGGNDQSGVWGGIIRNAEQLLPSNTGIVAITKIGGGVETFTNVNTYTGATTISNGVLQLINSGSIPNTPNVTIDGGTFDVSSVSYTIPAAQNINVNGGTFFINTGTTSSGGLVNFTNGTLKITTLSGPGNGTGTPSLTEPTLNIGGVNNFIQPAGMPPIPTYPAVYPVIKYTTLNGNASTFSAVLPTGGFPQFAGYISNDVVGGTKTIYLVLTNGPVTPQLTWFGSTGGSLDSAWNLVDNDWTNAPAGHLASYSDGSLVIFDDTAKTNVVSLNIDATPLGITITNVNLNYTLVGNGGLHGASTNTFNKLGSGKLTLDNLGTNDLSDTISISGGIVQVGINDTGGGLGSGTVGNNGVLVFNRINNNLIVSNAISGSGSLLVSNAAGTTLTLAGANSFGGGSSVIVSNVLQAGNASALGTGTNLIANSAALDINGFSLSGAAVNVSGAGLTTGGVTNGAIYNSAASSSGPPSVTKVTLLGDTVFGCPPNAGASTSNRWDIRGTGAALSTGGNAYNLIKIGINQVSIVDAAVDPMLNNIDVQGGELGFQESSTGLGNTGANLYIRNNAALEMYNATNQLNKQIQMGTTSSDTTSLLSDSGNNTIIGPMTLNGTVNVTVTNGTMTLSNSTGGSGSLNQNGSGTLMIAGSSSYNGGTMVNGGTFIINGINNSTGTQDANQLTAAAGTTVGGSGTYTVPVDIEGVLWPGVSGKPSTLSVGNNVDYEDNSSDTWGALSFGGFGGVTTNIFSLNSTPTAGGGINDLINVTGDLYANGAAIFINPLGSLQTGNTYTLVNYSGSKISSYSGTVLVAPAVQPSRYQFNLNQGSGNNSAVTLTVSTGAGTMEWNNAAGNSVWDVATTLNWTNTGTATPVNPTDYQFYQEDSVVLDDSIANTAGNTTLTITNAAVTNNIITALLPTTITVNSTNNNYTINGVGKISGNVNIIKKGPSMFTIANTNDFTGTVRIIGGTLVANNASALGSTTSVTVTNSTLLLNATNALGSANTVVTVTNAGTLDVGGPSLPAGTTNLVGGRLVQISGWGVNSNGCIINSSTNLAQESAFENLTLIGDAAIGGNGSRWDVGRISVGTGVLSTGGHAYNLYKVGSNYVAFLGLSLDTNLANIDIKGGTLAFQQAGNTMGNPSSNLTVETGATLEFYNSSTNLSSYTKQFVLNGDGTTATITNENGVTTINGSMTLNGGCIIGGASTGLTNNAPISGSGSLTKSGSCALILTTNETYTGNTTVNAGTLSLIGNASIATSTNITLGGGTIDVSGRVNNTLTLVSGQTLAGSGTINGSLSNLDNAIIAPGTATTTGVINVTTNIWTSGFTTIVKINTNGNMLPNNIWTNDVLAASGNINYAGVLDVTNISATALVAGNSFQFFNAATYSGSFSTLNLPTLSAGLTWVNSLITNGTLIVVSTAPPTPPHITGIVLSGTTLTITATNGSDGGSWTLLQSTNVSLPLSQWQTNIQGTFDGSGDLSTNIANTVSNTQEFYILKQ